MIWIFLFILILFNLFLGMNKKLAKKFKVGYINDDSITGCIILTVIILVTILIGYKESLFNDEIKYKNTIKYDYQQSKQCSDKIRKNIIDKLINTDTKIKLKEFILKNPVIYIHSFSFIDGLGINKYQGKYITILSILLILLIVYYIWLRKIDYHDKIYLNNCISGFILIIYLIYSIILLGYTNNKYDKIKKQTIIEYHDKKVINNCLYLDLLYGKDK